jgi:hypothetical protein
MKEEIPHTPIRTDMSLYAYGHFKEYGIKKGNPEVT